MIAVFIAGIYATQMPAAGFALSVHMISAIL
jgi:hypothetical protein